MTTWDPELADLMDRYRFSIVEMRTLRSASSPWERSPDGQLSFDSKGRWREVALQVRRDLTCERCGQPFSYTFRVVEEGHVHRGMNSPALARLPRALEQQLRRRVRCPHCREIQQQARRAFIRREVRHSLIGGAAIGGGLLGSLGLLLGGYSLAGGWGLALGIALSVGLVLGLTRWMLARVLDAP
jgi:hypothetical protein